QVQFWLRLDAKPASLWRRDFAANDQHPFAVLRHVARHGSIREAAEELHVAQSALSRQIQKLEQQLGVPLFQRHARGVELTSAGEIYLRHARSSLRQDERVRSELDALKGLRHGTINLQSIESLV